VPYPKPDPIIFWLAIDSEEVAGRAILVQFENFTGITFQTQGKTGRIGLNSTREDNCKIEVGVGYDQTLFWSQSHTLKTYINCNYSVWPCFSGKKALL
jgi:hypothetical protein